LIHCFVHFGGAGAGDGDGDGAGAGPLGPESWMSHSDPDHES